MKLTSIVRFSFSALKDRRTRSILTILMVALGIALITALDGLGGGINGFITDQFSVLAPNVMTVTPVDPLASVMEQEEGFFGGGYRGESPPKISLTKFTVDAIQPISGVEDVIPSYSGSVQLVSRGRSQFSQLIGMDSFKLSKIIPTIELEEGELVDPFDTTGAVLGFNLAHPAGEATPFAKVGNVVRVELESFDMRKQAFFTDEKSFIVRGIFEESGNPQYDNAIVIPLSVANSFLEKSSEFDSIIVVTDDSDINDSVEEKIREIYGEEIGITSPIALLETINSIMGGVTIFISAIGGVSILVGGVGIVTTLITAVMERTREIGTLKALGATSRNILLLFLSESFVIGVLGSIVGVMMGVTLGMGLIPLFGSMFGSEIEFEFAINPVFSAGTLGLIFITGIAISSIAGLYPAWRASKLLPVKALRKE